MKLWILMPCLMVGTAFADGFATAPQAQQTSSPTQQPMVSLQTMPKAVSPAVSAPTAKPEEVRKIDPQYPFGRLTEPMSYLAFAAIIKYQFPGHDYLDSLALARRAVAAYPVYADIVKFPASN